MEAVLTKTKHSPAAPLRESLAAALREAKESAGVANKQRAVIDSLRGRIKSDLKHAVEKTGAGIEQAQRDYADSLAKAAVQGKAAPASGVKVARQIHQDAEDELQAQKAALDRLEDELRELLHDAREKKIAAEAAISGVLADELRAMVKRAEQILEPFWPLRRVLLDAVQASVSEHKSATDLLASQRERQPFDEALKATGAIFGPLTKKEAPGDYWRVARERLRADPYSPLPDSASFSPNPAA